MVSKYSLRPFCTCSSSSLHLRRFRKRPSSGQCSMICTYASKVWVSEVNIASIKMNGVRQLLGLRVDGRAEGVREREREREREVETER